MANSPTIAIVGAGPAGLTLARLLQVSSAPVSIAIFEKDASPSSRTYQGGTLDLHSGTGLDAIKAANLWDEFQKYARYEGEELVIGDKNATELVHMKDAPQLSGYEARPEIDRERLKELLLHSVDPSLVRWGKHLKSINSTGVLTFDDGATAGPFDLVVGADGAWSKVRHVLTDVRPHYSGISGISSNIEDPNKRYPDLSKLVGRGSYFTYSDCRSLMAQRMGDDSIKVGCYMMKDPTYAAQLIDKFRSDEAGLKEAILDHFHDWAPELRQWIQVSTKFQPWPLYELPIGHTWEHKKGYTLIGDSAHLMTPFAGEGVNAAMKDALELSEVIIASRSDQTDLDVAVAKFEEGMFPRTTKVQQETMRNKNTMFRADAPIGFLIAMIHFLAEESGKDLSKGIWRWIPVTKVVYSYFWIVSAFGGLRRRLRNWWLPPRVKSD